MKCFIRFLIGGCIVTAAMIFLSILCNIVENGTKGDLGIFLVISLAFCVYVILPILEKLINYKN